MKKKLYFICIFLLFLAFTINQINSLNVELVAQVFRHGHRYSVYNLFNSKFKINLRYKY